MNEKLSSNPFPNNEFKLLAYLSADLLRAQEIIHGNRAKSSGFVFWLGVFSPRFFPILLCRLAYWFHLLRLSPIAKLFSLINFALFGIEIAVRCPIGRGLYLPHTQGTVIGAALIGENVTVFQGVTLGALEVDFSYSDAKRPTVGNGVIIGSGAKVLGGVTLGDCSRVGANAVVLMDVPSEKLAVGIPAKIV